MGESLSSTNVIFNVLIQVVNLVIFFLFFKFFLGDKLSKSLEQRKALIEKLKNADQEYKNIIESAENKSREILSDAKKHSEAILEEGELLSKERSATILKEGEQKAKNILAEAHKEAKKIEEELANNRSTSLKSTSKLLVKKILQNDEDLQDKYLDSLINDLKK
ncbi:MAG: hypothetical protein M0P94_01250 [Candidatus Absconditabacterales bacterium]|nr:hypothetical protein [Candidatus Absconditabacterales bacterium]